MISFDLTGCVALVTGASRGLGAAMARALAERGATVALHASRSEPTEVAAAIAAECGVKTACFVTDLDHPQAAETLVPGVLDRFGRLDILVNNAGIIVALTQRRMKIATGTRS